MGEHQVIRRAVFLDRDGVLNRPLVRDGKPYPPPTVTDFEILPEVPEACRLLKAAGFLLIVTTNQPDVGRGTQSRDIVEQMHAILRQQLPLDRIDTCFHGGTESCDCRKPKPGLLLSAARELAIDLAQSFMVGDRWRDIDCGHAAGCRTIFIDRGYVETLRIAPDFRAPDLLAAAHIILAAPTKTP